MRKKEKNCYSWLLSTVQHIVNWKIHLMASSVEQQIKWTLTTPEAEIRVPAQGLTLVILLHLTNNVNKKAVKDGPRTWVPDTHGRLGWSSWLLALTCTDYNHCTGEPADGRFCFSVSHSVFKKQKEGRNKQRNKKKERKEGKKMGSLSVMPCKIF